MLEKCLVRAITLGEAQSHVSELLKWSQGNRAVALPENVVVPLQRPVDQCLATLAVSRSMIPFGSPADQRE